MNTRHSFPKHNQKCVVWNKNKNDDCLIWKYLMDMSAVSKEMKQFHMMTEVETMFISAAVSEAEVERLLFTQNVYNAN